MFFPKPPDKKLLDEDKIEKERDRMYGVTEHGHQFPFAVQRLIDHLLMEIADLKQRLDRREEYEQEQTEI